MKIAFLLMSKYAGKGGLENVLLEINDSFSKKNIETKFFFGVPTQDKDFMKKLKGEIAPSIPIIFRNKSFFRPRIIYRKYYEKSIEKIFRQIDVFAPDALISMDFPFPEIQKQQIEKLLKKKPDIAIIFYNHSSLANGLRQTISEKKYLHCFDSHISISDDNTKQLQRVLENDNPKIYTVYNPVQAAKIIPYSKKAKFIYLGRIDDKNKRVYELLKIMTRLSGDWSLDIIGDGASDPENMARIKNLAKDPRLKNITFHGWQDKPWEVIKEASALLLHSTHEGFGLVLVEAMMRGIPCVCSDCPGGVRNIVEENKNGWLYDMNDEKSCQNILQGIIEKTITMPLQEEIQKTVEKFKTEIVINNIIKAIKETIYNKKVRGSSVQR